MSSRRFSSLLRTRGQMNLPRGSAPPLPLEPHRKPSSAERVKMTFRISKADLQDAVRKISWKSLEKEEACLTCTRSAVHAQPCSASELYSRTSTPEQNHPPKSNTDQKNVLKSVVRLIGSILNSLFTKMDKTVDPSTTITEKSITITVIINKIY